MKAEADTERHEVRTRFLRLSSARVAQRAGCSCACPGASSDESLPRHLGFSPDPDPWPEGDALAPDARGVVADYGALQTAVDTELAIAVIQARAGMSGQIWARYPYRFLFEPLGMHRTVLDRAPSGQFIASTYMHASAVDWARLFLARDGV